MATVKIKFRKNVKALWGYISSGKEQDDPSSFFNCTENSVTELFLGVQEAFGKTGVNQAVHIIQSWGSEESRENSPEKLNELGNELCKRSFPGHDFAVVTHTNTGKTHNHIIVNPVSSQTGKRIQNKKEHLYALRYQNDRIARENNLSVIVNHSREHWDKMSDKVRAIHNRVGFSRLGDLKEKLKFSMSIATSFDEYSAYLNYGFGIKTKIRGKTISYVYPGMNRGRKANKLGARYDYERLSEKFRSNDQKLIYQGLKSHVDIENKDYGLYHKFSRNEKEFKVPESKINNSLIPIEDIKKVRLQSIMDYCEAQGLTVNPCHEGFHRLSGREYIKFKDGYWENEKNNTQGSLIEFIANFRRKDFLSAISEGANNKSLQSLSETFDIPSPSFRSYYVPESKNNFNEKKVLDLISRQNKFNKNTLISLKKSGQANFYENNRFKLYPLNNKRKSLTFYKNSNGAWFTRKISGLNENLINKKGITNNLILFDSIQTFLKSRTMDSYLKSNELSYNVVVPLSPLRHWVSEKVNFLSSFENIRLVRDESKSVFDDILSFKNKKEGGKKHFMTIDEMDNFIKSNVLNKNKKLNR